MTNKVQVMFDNLPGVGRVREDRQAQGARRYLGAALVRVPRCARDRRDGPRLRCDASITASRRRSGTPRDIIATLNTAINKALADPKMKERIAGFGGMPLALTPGGFGKMVADETVKWEKVVKTVGLSIE